MLIETVSNLTAKLFSREYALQRVRDGFKANKTKEADCERELQTAKESLEIIKRQVCITMFALF